MVWKTYGVEVYISCIKDSKPTAISPVKIHIGTLKTTQVNLKKLRERSQNFN